MDYLESFFGYDSNSLLIFTGINFWIFFAYSSAYFLIHLFKDRMEQYFPFSFKSLFLL